jgi:uncharacterized protein
MQTYLGKPLYSAKDLLTFLGCSHATALDLDVLQQKRTSPDNGDDPYLDLLKRKGNEHEKSYLDKLKGEGKTVVEIQRLDSIEEMAELTRKAMQDGADVIYQGALTIPGWHGYSDFLIKVAGESALGDYSYEVVDTKLARTAKPKHVIQLSVYSGMVEQIQGRLPDKIHVVVGDGSMTTHRLADFIYYCNHVRGRFTDFVSGETRETVAERCPHCKMCHWSDECEKQWDDEGNLRLVAGLGAQQATKLRAHGISTIQELAELSPDVSVQRIQNSTLERLRAQARLQQIKRTTDRDEYEILPIDERRGFARLPKPSDGDLFFDIEGDPNYSPQGSLEYLFGFHYVDDGEHKYRAFWATDKQSEKKAFEDTLDFITSRLARYPDAYVYHYASYEQTVLRRLAAEYGGTSHQEEALKRLAQVYGTRENEVDDLLRNRKLVDLYKVVREGIRTSEPRYSLKNLEVFFAPQRTQKIKGGGDSIVAFETWLVSRDDQILREIEEYNAFDCHSTLLCRDWLLSLRLEGVKWFNPAEEIADRDPAREEKRRQDDAIVVALKDALVAGVEGPDREWREMLGFLLEYHRREERREWWDFFRRFEPSYDWVGDPECIGCLTADPTHTPVPVKQSTIRRFRFDEQDFKFETGDSVYRTDTGKSGGAIVAINEDERWLDLKAGNRQPPFTDGASLVPGGPRPAQVITDALRRFAAAVIEGTADRYGAVMSILKKEPPRIDRLPELRGSVNLLADTIATLGRMNGTHVVIQGPPGCGKTFTSAHAIVSLIEAKQRVGVMSMTHKAINNLLKDIEKVAKERGVSFTGIKQSSSESDWLNGSVFKDGDNKPTIFDGNHDVVAGTAWLFSAAELDGKLDYLFVDEAGQVCLANVIASGLCAKNIVLVGDQMQLPQVIKGQHPHGSGVSGLDYLMGDWATVPPDRGIFLEKTWRMHPKLCRFVSGAFYEGRLQSADCTSGQELSLGSSDCDGELARYGLRFVAVAHEGNSQRSSEEAARLARAYRTLLGQSWVNQRGETRTIGIEDILVVSPYNMQVNLLVRKLPAGARVGTVDKFQGQEAAVVLVSMAASSGEYVSRGVDFLFSPNRLNVALSRARCLSVIFCSPWLLDVVCNDVDKMKMVNRVCWANDFAMNDPITDFLQHN